MGTYHKSSGTGFRMLSPVERPRCCGTCLHHDFDYCESNRFYSPTWGDCDGYKRLGFVEEQQGKVTGRDNRYKLWYTKIENKGGYEDGENIEKQTYQIEKTAP